MTTTDRASAEQLESWVLASYQRLERLRVPAFAEGRRELRRQRSDVLEAKIRPLPATGLPRELCGMSAWLSGFRAEGLDATARLSLFFRYLACPLRYEPLSESAIHKAVPSSRGRYPLKFILLQPSEAGTRAHAYVPELHALHELGIIESAMLPEGGAALVCIGRAWRYAEEYGEFAHVPCVIESGHAFAQAHHLAGLLQIEAMEDPDRELGRAFCERPFEVPLYCIGLRPGMDLAQIEVADARLSMPRPYPQMAERFPRLERFQHSVDSGASSLRRMPLAAPATAHPEASRTFATCGVLDLMRRRSSGNDRGLVTSVMSEVPVGTSASIAETWCRIRDLRPVMSAERKIRLSLLWLARETGRARGIYDLDDGALSASEWKGDLQQAIARMLPYANTPYNFSALAAILIIQTEILSAMEGLGQGAFRDIHIAAGATAQDFSLAATAHGLYARPVKMMREARLESELPLRGQVVYLVIAGYSRSANPTLELL